MQRNNDLLLFALVGTLLFSVGCSTAIYSPKGERLQYMSHYNETYFNIINRKAREEARANRAVNPWSQKRHIGFFGILKEREKKFGVKVVFPL